MHVDTEFDRLFGETKALRDDSVAYRPLLGRWLLEMAMLFEWHKPASSRRRRSYPEALDDDDFCKLTGMEPPDQPDLDDDEEAPPPPKSAGQWKTHFKRHLDRLRKVKVDTGLPLFRNIALLSDLLKLSKADRMLLLFSASMTLFSTFRGAIMPRNVSATHQLLNRILAHLSGLAEDDFLAATGIDGILVSSGLVQVHHGVKDLEDKVELLKGVANVLMMPHRNSEELTGRFLKKADPPTLTLDNFPHLSADTALLLPYLQHAVQGRTTGVNILLHGKPGVGKSEYVKALAAANGLDLYEISFADAGGEPIKGTGRLKAFAFCQNLLARSENALLLFDEIEDVFPDNSFAMLFGGDEQGDTAGKAWINRTMERNPVPALWVSNRIHQIDPAYLRRFDYSVQFPTPPLAVRRTIAQYHLGCFNPPENWLERIAAAEEITPAQLERAAKVASLVGEANSLKLVEQVLDKSCTLLNTKAMPTRMPVKTGYSLEYLNVDADVTALLEGLQKRPSASLCFYGAAGTGKSELARHLADQLGKPLLIKRASDLLDKYVGESEKNIAAMFAEARRHGAVLVLDEADSFLSDRREAQRSWEVTQVNELLTQMEAFDGIFICTTNLMERLDQASLRRFSFKVRFDYLTKPQRIGMFRQELTRLGGDLAHADSYEPQVARLDRLTPGDFAVAVRQFELWGTAATAQKLYEQLAKECEAKGAPVRKIGFGA